MALAMVAAAFPSFILSDNSAGEQRPRQGLGEQGSLYDADNVIADISNGAIDTMYVTPFLDNRGDMI